MSEESRYSEITRYQEGHDGEEDSHGRERMHIGKLAPNSVANKPSLAKLYYL